MQADTSKLMSTSDFVSARQHIFPSATSFDWFCRTNRKRLIEAGALSKPAGRTLVNQPRFDEVIFELGQARMAEAA